MNNPPSHHYTAMGALASRGKSIDSLRVTNKKRSHLMNGILTVDKEKYVVVRSNIGLQYLERK